MTDKYDAAIAYINAHGNFQNAVRFAWISPRHNPAGVLFQFVTPSGEREVDGSGCLTMIRNNVHYHAHDRYGRNDELTAEITGDARIPKDWESITPETLPIFAEWQRRLDREIRGRR